VAGKDASKRPRWRLILTNGEHLEGFLLEKWRGGQGSAGPFILLGRHGHFFLVV